jgi:hypothetical protein
VDAYPERLRPALTDVVAERPQDADLFASLPVVPFLKKEVRG